MPMGEHHDMHIPYMMPHDHCYPMDHGYGHHGYGHHGYDDYGCHGYGHTFAIIVVLFILLIIVGAAGFVGKGRD